jgi:hypothetical protein
MSPCVAVSVVGQANSGAALGLHLDGMPCGNEFPDAAGCHADAVFLGLDFHGDANLHWFDS